MICNRCGYKNYGQDYCEFCISFGKYQNENGIDKSSIPIRDVLISIDYDLTSMQKDISDKLLTTSDNVLIEAVCGAGKTEIIIAKVRQSLLAGKRVGIAIPRKEVVIEIGKRIKDIFSKTSVAIVYGGSSSKEAADITIFTTHQSYRFTNTFGLLIIDEVDAFPYAGNNLLKQLTKHTTKGQIIQMSATPLPDEDYPDTIFSLDQRFHAKPIPVPSIIRSKNMKETLLVLLLKQTRKVICYFPTIKMANEYASYLGANFNIDVINSKTNNNSDILSKFRSGKTTTIFSTLTLERGITLKGLDVIVVNACHELLGRSNLIQIAGRVGRKLEDTGGSVIFISQNKSIKLRNVIKEIETKNMSIVQD